MCGEVSEVQSLNHRCAIGQISYINRYLELPLQRSESFYLTQLHCFLQLTALMFRQDILKHKRDVLVLSLSLPSQVIVKFFWIFFFHPVPDNPALANIELITDAGKSINLGPQHVFCDMPLTVRLDTHNVAVAAIKLSTFDEKMEVDAAMLSSGPGSPLCSSCQPLLYRVQRLPPFSSKAPSPVMQQTFTDR